MVATSQEKFGAFVASLSPVTPASGDSFPLVRNQVTYRVPATTVLPQVPPYIVADITHYGGRGDGVTDNTAAWNAAIAASNSILFPPGIYNFNSAIAYTFATDNASVSIVGQGSGTTVLRWASTGKGLTINYAGIYNSAHISGLSFLNGNAGGTALTLNRLTSPTLESFDSALTELYDLNIGYATNGADWANGIVINGVTNCSYINITIQGTRLSSYGGTTVGVQINGASNNPTVVHNFLGCFFNFTAVGVQVGSHVEGIALSQCNFTLGSIGINIPTLQTNFDQLYVDDCQFNCTIGINLLSYFNNTAVKNSIFIIPPGGTGIYALFAFYVTIGGCAFNAVTQGAGAGIYFNNTNGATELINGVTSSTFVSLLVGIFIGALTTGLFVGADNIFSQNVSNITNAAGANNAIETRVINQIVSLVGVTAPATPMAGTFALYVDVSDNKLKAKGPSGTVTILALP